MIPCDGGGVSKPRAVWTRPDGAPLSPIPGLRQFRSDGSMVLQPFSGEQFRTEVHSGLFRCQLTSDAGSIGSRDVRVTAGKYSINRDKTFYLLNNGGYLQTQRVNFVNSKLCFSCIEKP